MRGNGIVTIFFPWRPIRSPDEMKRRSSFLILPRTILRNRFRSDSMRIGIAITFSGQSLGRAERADPARTSHDLSFSARETSPRAKMLATNAKASLEQISQYP